METKKGAAMAAKISSNLPTMPLDKLHRLWTNVREKRGQGPEETRSAAELLLKAIAEERKRRGPEATSQLKPRAGRAASLSRPMHSACSHSQDTGSE